MWSSWSTRWTRWRGYSSASERPTSERDVTAASSSSGWRSTRRAARAPVYPDAPATRTRLATQLGPQLVAQPRHDLLAQPCDLVVGQRAVVGRELEVQRERDALVVELVAVEDAHRTQQRAARLAHSAHDVGRGHRGVDDHGEVLAHGREARDVAVLDALGDQREHRPELELEGRDALEVPVLGDERVQLAEPPDLGAAGPHDAGAPRVQEGPRAVRGVPVDGHRPEHRAGHRPGGGTH